MENLKMRGIIQILDENDSILSEVENAVTYFWEDFVAAAGLDVFYTGVSAVEAGQSFICSPIFNNSGYFNYQAGFNLLPCIYLLNLPDSIKSSLSKNTNLLPVYDSNFEINSDYIVGIGTATYSTTEAKQGYLEVPTGANLVNHRKHGLKWKWDAGVLSGTYNCIAIGFNVMHDIYSGACIFRGLEANNQFLGETAGAGYLVVPNVKSEDGAVVITGENEILLGDSTATQKGRKVLNLLTGEVTLLDSADIRYNFPLNDARYAQTCINGFWVYCNGSSVKKVDVKTKAETTIASTGYDFFIYNGFLYSKYSSTVYRAYSLSTWAYSSSGNLTIANMGFPADFLETKSGFTLRVSNVGDNFLVSYHYAYSGGAWTGGSNYMGKCLICSDIENVSSSIIEVLPYINTNLGVLVGGKKYFFNNFVPQSMNSANQIYYMNAAGTGTLTMKKNGLKMTTEGLYGNMMSYKIYDTDQTIPSDKALKISYTYTFDNPE